MLKLTITFILIAFPAVAQDAGKECAAMENAAKRLLCYDGIFRTSTKSSAGFGQWATTEETSKISDVKNVFLSVDSIEKLTGRFGRREHATLLIRCREKVTDLYITFGGHFMSSHRDGTVTYRVDKTPAKTKHMTNSGDHMALGLWSGTAAIPFIRELMTGTTLFLQATPMSESPVTAEFPLSGLQEAIKPLQAACNWQTQAPAPKSKPTASPPT